MRRSIMSLLACFMVMGICLTGCGPEKAASSSEAIEQSRTMDTTQEQVDYLVRQGRAFYNSEEFQGAVDIAQHVLRHLDSDSQAARDLLELAREALEAQARSAMDQASAGLGF